MLINLFVSLLVIAIFFLIPQKKKELRIIYFMVLSIGLEFLINKISPNNTPIANQLITFFIFFGMPLYYFAIKGFTFWNFPSNYVIIIIVISAFYLIFLSVIRSISPQLYLNDYRVLMHGIILFLVCNSIFNKYALLRFEKYFFIILITLFIIALIQYFGPSFVYDYLAQRNSFYRGDEYVNAADIKALYSRFGNPINTIFWRYNHFGNFFSVLCITLLIMHIRLGKINYKRIIFIILIGSFGVLVSGNRVSLISFIIGVLLILYFLNKKLTYILIFGGIISFFILYTTLISTGLSAVSQKGFESPLERMSGIFVVLINPASSDYSQLSTFGLSILLIPYIIQNPIIGVGRYYKGGYTFIFPGSANQTDATLFFYTAEFGIIGIGLLLLTFYYLVYQIKKNDMDSYKLLRIVFIVLLIQRVTDAGLFLRVSNYLFFIVAGAFWAYYKNNLNQGGINSKS